MHKKCLKIYLEINNMETIILVTVILGIVFIGKYAIREGQRIEQQKEFEKNLKNFDKKNKQQ